MVGIRIAVITGYGINAEAELREAFRLEGGSPELIHIQDLVDSPERLLSFRILAFPGGFSFGDHLGSGLVFANLVRRSLRSQVKRFLEEGGLIIGICNGFQSLVKMGVLPNLDGDWRPQVSLVHNASGAFVDSWVALDFDPRSPCVWTSGIAPLEAPIRHGEGRFIAENPALLRNLEERHLIAVRYRDRNPNGSQNGVAGVCDPTGRIFGLMPHPEAFLFPENHPRWTREPIPKARGREIFRNGINWIKENG